MHQIKNRADVPSSRKWILTDILTEDQIEKMIEDVRSATESLRAFSGKINENNVLEVLLTVSRTSYILEKLYVYANMKWDEDKSDSRYAELSSRIEMLATDFYSDTSFVAPSISAMKKSVLERMKRDPDFDYFSMYLSEIIRKKKHLLSDKEEAILAKSSSFADGFKTAFSVFDNVNVPFGTVEIDGESQKLTHGLYSILMQNPDREVRKNAYEAMYKGYVSMINTVSEIYAGSVKADCFFANVRKYDNSLAQALYSDNVPVKVYENLIKSVRKNAKKMHDYVEYRRKILQVDQLKMYDMYVSLVKETEKEYPFDDAYEIVCKALYPLGEEYVDILRQAKNSGWIDVEETPNKRSGAYSWGVYGTHPYVLLNHKGTVHDLFTIAHEMGHAMHSYYSNKTQCYEKAGYSIFVAEIASTVNEVLLIKYLLKTAEGNDRKYLLSYYLDMIRTTLFRQTMFSEFEKFTHETIERGEPLSYRVMCEKYAELNKYYYGDAVETDVNISYEWSRIPHFYNAFYVYKYATGITCAINIANMLLSDPKKIIDYKRFLSAGGSAYPLEIIGYLGIDLTKLEPYKVAMKEFSETLKELLKTK